MKFIRYLLIYYFPLAFLCPVKCKCSSLQYEEIFASSYPYRLKVMDSLIKYWYNDSGKDFITADQQVTQIINYVETNGDQFDILNIRQQRMNSIYSWILRKGIIYNGYIGELHQLLEESKQQKFKVIEARIYSLFGQYYFTIENNYRLAFENFIKSREVYKDLSVAVFPEKVYSYYIFATKYYEFNDFDSSLEICQEILKEKIAEIDKEILVYDLLGECFVSREKYDSARLCFEKILQIAPKLPYHSVAWIGIATGKIGETWFYNNDFEKAEPLLLKGLNICSQPDIDLNDNITVFASKLSRIYLGKNSDSRALDYAKLSRKAAWNYDRSIMFQKLKSYRIHLGYLKAFSDYYRKIGNYREALNYLDTFMVYQDKIQYQVNVSEKYKAQLDIDKEKAGQKEELEQKDRQRQAFVKNSLIAIVGLLIFVFTLFYSWLKLRHKNKSEKLLAEKLLKDKQLELERQSKLNEVERRKLLELKNEVIEKSLEEKDLLLKEIHHRVKNNLQIISSLFELQGNRLNDQSAKAAIADAKGRVMSIALMHQQLYQNDIMAYVEFDQFVRDLCNQACSSVKPDELKIQFEYALDPVRLALDLAIPLGLALNELLTNSFKYAFGNQTHGKIEIVIKANQTKACLADLKNSAKNQLNYILYRDNGNGLPPSMDVNNTNSLGLKLVNQLTKQIKCRLDYRYNHGAEFIMQF